MRRSLVRHESKVSQTTVLIGIVVIAVVIWIIMSRSAQYNAETVTIQRDARGRIAGMTVNRSAH